MADTPGKSASKAHNNESASVNLNLPPDVAQESFDPSDSASTTAATNTTSTRTTPRTPSTPANSASASLPPHPSRFRVPASPRTVAMTNDDSSRAAKVAIPRLKRSLETNDAAAKPGGRHRVTHACEPCRHRKTKCSGERPTCRHCQDFKIECYYADGKRDRVKKQFGSMAEKLADYERILRDLQTRVSDADANLIANSLDKAALLDADDVPAEAANMIPIDADATSEASGAESDASGGAGSTGALDKTDEDFTREGAKATGFMGKNSDVTWIQRLRHENKQSDLSAASLPEHRRTSQSNTDTAVQDSSYYLNDLSISIFEAVDPFEMPTPEHARILFNTYMDRVHATFPIVGRINLQNQFTKYLARPMNRPPAKWLAIINVIFAIAARLSHLVQADWRADERDHLIYFTRARLLAIDSDTLFNHPDLQTIQVLGLMAFYLLCVEQVNRAWTLTGLAIRDATSLGLNMRNESSELSDALKEIRYRVWWALYILDHRLCAMTGRIGCLVDEHCTTPLPVPVLEEDFETETGQKLLSGDSQRVVRAPSLNSSTPTNENAPASTTGSKDGHKFSRSPSVQQSQQTDLEWARDIVPNSALCFLHLIQLCRITQNVFQQIYNPTAVTRKWSDIQSAIETLNQRAESWYRCLPAAFDFGRKQRDRDLYEARLTLGFHYYAAKQIINRPCLCRMDLKIPGQSAKSSELNHACALACVKAAREQLMLIPDVPNGPGLLSVGPWVTIVHLLVQSCTVLMLELSFRAHHMPDQADEILEAGKKAVRWLHALGEQNLAAARAWQLCSTMLVDAAKKIGRTVDDLPDQQPKSYYSPGNDMYPTTQADMNDMGGMPQHAYNQNTGFSQQHMTRPMTMVDLHTFGGFTAFDDPMQYGHYLSTSDQEAVTMSNDMDMRYMHAYNNQNQNQSDGGGSAGSHPRGPMSGFG